MNRRMASSLDGGAGRIFLTQADAAEHGDMLILPIQENMNRGKSQTFMEWASEHGRVPDCTYLPDSQGQYVAKCSGDKRPDFVMKADDDAFINLAELEKRLRIMPRSKSYWGCELTTLFDNPRGARSPQS